MTQNTPQHGVAGAPTGRICYLHIGPHKTGTTSIQNALFVNADRLAKIGLHYPTLSGDRPGRQRRNHTPLSRHNILRAEDLKTAPFWSELSEKIAKIDGSIIVSTEHFADSLRDEERFDKVIGFFREHGFGVVAVAYVRDQPGWLNSWYTQDQRNFISQQSFSEFLDSALESGLVDPWAFLRRFIDDPDIGVRVVSFEQAVKMGLAKSFLNAIGAPADFEIPEPQASNPNLGVKGLYAAQEIMRRVDVRVRSLPNYADLYESFKLMMKGRDWEKTAYVGVSPEHEKRIRDHYRASNDAFAREWFGGADWETICPPRSTTQREFDFDAATESEKKDVLEVVEGMVDLINQDPSLPRKGGKGLGKKGPGKGQGKGKGVGARAAAGPKAAGDGPKKVGPGGPKAKKAGSGDGAGKAVAKGSGKGPGKGPGKGGGGKGRQAEAGPLQPSAAKAGPGKKGKKAPTPVVI